MAERQDKKVILHIDSDRLNTAFHKIGRLILESDTTFSVEAGFRIATVGERASVSRMLRGVRGGVIFSNLFYKDVSQDARASRFQVICR